MGLFPKDHPLDETLRPNAPQRMAWTRELGTRKLILGFVAVLTVFFIVGKVQDHFLLQHPWKPLSPDRNGLTVVGTLDSRESYERNMFRIVQANKSSRAELTDFGWRTIFDQKNGELFSDRAGNAIQYARQIDDVVGYAMLEPYLKAGIAKAMGQSNWSSVVRRDYPIEIEHPKGNGIETLNTTLGELLDRYSREGKGAVETRENDTPEGGSGSGRDVEHGIAIPADTLIKTCPIVLTGAQFSEAWLEEHPPSVVGGRTYTVHLGLTPEGRSRFFQWSHDHVNESLVFVLKHEVQTAGRVKQTLDVSEWEIGPLRDGEAAKALVDYVNKADVHRESAR
jgi:hypothetical protein